MLLAHKIELRPTKRQEEFFLQACGCSRHLWNQLVAHFSKDGIKFSLKESRAKFYELRETEFPWYKDISANIFQSTINNLESAFKGFFKEKKGFPRFKKKGERDSFNIDQTLKFSVIGRNLRLEKFNKGRKEKAIKMREKLRFSGKPKQVTISRKANKWFASILVEVESGYNDCLDSEKQEAIGVDLGLKDFATLSNGEIISKNNNLTRNLDKLRKLSKSLSRKKKGSNNRNKARITLAKLHMKIYNLRRSKLHSVSHKLTKEFKIVCLEDLKLPRFKKNKGMNRAISDAGFYELRRQIEYKSFLRGGRCVFVYRFFPSSKLCNHCGWKKEDLTLKDRLWRCEGCGSENDRDLNAAKNILDEGLRIA